MTAYRGTITLTLSGLLNGTNPFTAVAPVTVEVPNAGLAPGGTLSAILGGRTVAEMPAPAVLEVSGIGVLKIG